MDKKEIGIQLKRIREQLGLSAYIVAKNGNIRADQVKAIEDGGRNYTIDGLIGYLKGINYKINFEVVKE